MEIKIVPCKEEYIADCVRISVTAYEYIHDKYADHLGRALHDAVMADWRPAKARSIEEQQRGEHAIVALADGEVAGFASWYDGKYCGQVGNNAVDPKYRGNGIAGLLYHHVLDDMRRHGYRYAFVQTGLDDGHAPARRAYGKVGFTKGLPYMTYYQVLNPVEHCAPCKWDDGVELVPYDAKYRNDCRSLAVTAWEGIHDSYIEQIGRNLHDGAIPNWRADTQDAVEQLLSSGRGYVLLADGKVAGFIGYRAAGEIGQISNNAVDPAYRGRGFAGRMHAYVLDRMRDEGMKYARVQTGLDDGHAAARRAYQKAGFEKYLPSITFYQAL